MDEAIRTYEGDSRLTDAQARLTEDEASMQKMTREIERARHSANEAGVAFDAKVCEMSQSHACERVLECCLCVFYS